MKNPFLSFALSFSPLALLAVAGCFNLTTETMGTTGTGAGGGGLTGPICEQTSPTTPIDLCAAGSLPKSACTPTDPSCNVNDNRCLAPVAPGDAPVFGLRMAQLTIQKPAALSQGILLELIQSFVRPNSAACNVGGAGTLSWLLQFDLGAGTLKTGGALPVSDPTAGYAFFDGMITDNGTARTIAPATLKLDTSAPCGFSTTAADLTVPMFTTGDGSLVVLVPLHQVTMHGSLSQDHACIGAFDPVGLESNCCDTDSDHVAFREGGTAEGFFVLEEADTFSSGVTGESFCVMLSQDTQTFGDGAKPFARCKRDASGQIVFQGDWCAATNGPATADCHDAVRYTSTFAASAITIHD